MASTPNERALDAYRAVISANITRLVSVSADRATVYIIRYLGPAGLRGGTLDDMITDGVSQRKSDAEVNRGQTDICGPYMDPAEVICLGNTHQLLGVRMLEKAEPGIVYAMLYCNFGGTSCRHCVTLRPLQQAPESSTRRPSPPRGVRRRGSITDVDWSPPA